MSRDDFPFQRRKVWELVESDSPQVQWNVTGSILDHQNRPVESNTDSQSHEGGERAIFAHTATWLLRFPPPRLQRKKPTRLKGTTPISAYRYNQCGFLYYKQLFLLYCMKL